ncbi:MAG: flagellar assembly protein A [Campylobacterota bacterium]|nr:flagellar assembly protein A [Campylobacterota bacterium]
MALFGDKKNQKTVETKKITPIIVRTSNVAKELIAVSTNHKIPVSVFDFRLLSVETFTKLPVDGKEEEWEELTSDEVFELHDETVLLSREFEIKQVYEIEIFAKEDKEENKLSNLQMSVGANSQLTKVYLTIKAGSEVTYYDDLEKDMLAEIIKRKLRANLTINIFDEVMGPELSNIIAKIRVAGSFTFDTKEVFLISEGLDPLATVDDKLILHYEKKQESEEDGDKVDYSKRGYLLSTTPGEMLIEYIKPKPGESGRNCRGQFLEPKEPVVKNEPTFNVTDKIKVVVGDDNITYLAQDGGYVTFENGTYDIRQDIDVAEISFKTTGSIESELDADVSINVKEKDVLKDAVGMGMDVEVNEINIEGNVGPNATVRANTAVVDGQTHKSSKIYANEAKVNIHKGFISGDEIHITRLEHGIIEAQKVTISQAMGGKIIANEVVIDTLASHVNIQAAHKIEIKRLKGEENKLIIDPVVMKKAHSSLESNEDQINEAKVHIKEVEAEIKVQSKKLKDNTHSFNEIKKLLAGYKKKGVKMPTAFVKKYKQFQAMFEHLQSLKDELKVKNDRYSTLSQKHKSFQNDIFDARVINHDRWSGHNEVIFRLVEPKQEVTFLPPNAAKIELLGLKKQELEEDEVEYFIEEVDE